MTSYSTKETASELRKHLRRVWPEVKFSVRCNRGTASAWIGVAWTDGPTYTQARAQWSQFQGAQFNGMTDSYDHIDPKLVCTNPAELPETRDYHCDGINGARGFSDEVVQATASQMVTENPEMAAAFAVEDIDPNTLTANTLHRSAAMLTITGDRWMTYLGEPLTGDIYDLGTAITAALNLTDYTTTGQPARVER
ncbi:LPD29 domain-containing protein [Williamsia sp. 1135]|uniref:LPD29 domain-containing protein n=1 Tax=Williamsia sp. 1135 TaxID=1889262 RepID=UPI000A1205A2|nr:LPD29 domain-containing protein [Williamsia sp. 1135]ORM35483.1 hypothetical protein BFL43_09180 [Williamsia sp. 1135]